MKSDHYPMSDDDLAAIRRARSVAWVDFQLTHPDEADAIDLAFMQDLTSDPARCLDFLAGIQALRTGDGCPAVVLATAGELRVWRRAKTREWMEKQ